MLRGERVTFTHCCAGSQITVKNQSQEAPTKRIGAVFLNTLDYNNIALKESHTGVENEWYSEKQSYEW